MNLTYYILAPTTREEPPPSQGSSSIYEIQHFTLCDGWINTWTIENEDGSSEPETFATKADAEAALAEFFAEIEEEIATGQRGEDEGYSRDEFRIVAVDAV